jgi:DNA helicase-2/ATP-dependent DNA helicase PcrA
VTITLTPEQQAIVDHPLVPIRVAAGAGTGKTTTVAHRVAGLVDKHGLDPEAILGITFTNKAAAELADRITEVLGDRLDPDQAIPVRTYHGFAAELLREFGPLVGVERSANLVSPIFARQLISEILVRQPIAGVDITSPIVTEKAITLASQLANNLVERLDPPEELDEVWAQRQGLAVIAALYRAEKSRLGVVDYGDLIGMAHRLVSNHPRVVEMIRQRYQAVVLDEYQDTDPAQRQLLRILFAGAVPVLAVGDEDQTIYEWRGASLENFRSFPVHFADGDRPATTLHLTLNRRSSPEILEYANALRQRIDTTERPPLIPREGAPPGSVRAVRVGTSVEEGDWIASDMIDLHQRGMAWSDMAVLFRKNRSMLVIHQALNRAGIPFQVANLGGLLSVPEIVDLHAWLRILERPEDGPAAARVLTGSHFRVGLADLVSAADWIRGREDEDFPFGFLEAIDRLEDLELSKTAAGRLRAFRDIYRRLVTTTQNATLVETCRLVLDATGAWADLGAMEPAAGLSARLNLYRFLDLAEGWSPLEGRPSLAAFLDHLDLMAEDPAEELDVARIAVAEAVSLITVHRAKGLEWPVVYLPAMVAGTFPSRSRYDDPFCKAESLPYEFRLDGESLPPISAQMKDADRHSMLKQTYESQEWRLAYVAATRAKRHLVVTGAHWYGHPETNMKPATPSEIWEMAAEEGELVADCPEPPPRPATIGDLGNRGPDPDPLFVAGWQGALREAATDDLAMERRAADAGLATAYSARVDDFEQMRLAIPSEPTAPAPVRRDTSVTGLVTYAVCPLRFYWAEVDRLPRRPNPAARRGVEIHRRIELNNLGVVPLTEIDDEHADVVDGPVGTRPYEVYQESRFAERRPPFVETPFELRLTDRVWARGRIDAVYDGPNWEIVDFKSGKRRTDEALRVQLEAYAVALHDTGILPDPAPRLYATFAYLGGDVLEEERHLVDDRWLAAARRRLIDLAGGIEAARFEPTPADHCRSCDFSNVCPAGQEYLSR